MKTSYYLFIIIFIFSKFSFAQNYQTLNQGRIVFFEDESKSVAALRIDSLSIDTDTILFPFKMFLPIDDFCFSPNISSWAGPKIIIKQNSENLFFNNQGDTITIKTNAVMNESWTFYQSEDLVVVAEVTDWKMQDFLDVEDSVKTISFQTFDKDMNTIEHSICEYNILLSENYGLLSVLNFYLFPETDYNDSYEFLPSFYLNLIGMTNPDMGFQNPTMFRVFDFQPEDELHIFEKLEENSGKAFQRRTVFQRNTILNYLERTDSNDSIVYKIERLSHYQNFQSDSTFYIHDTIICIIKPNVNFDKLPAEPDRDEDLAPIWLLKHDGFIFKSDYGDKFQFWYQSEDCWLLGYLEGGESYQYYIDGLGGKYFNNLEFEVDYFSVHSNSLVYYKKNGETWGNPLIITSVPNESITNKFSVYPNPTKNYITILSDSYQPIWVDILDLTGNLVKTEITHTNELLNINSLSKGFYIVRITDEKRNIFIKKLVKQ